jgi:hypothetical protein
MSLLTHGAPDFPIGLTLTIVLLPFSLFYIICPNFSGLFISLLAFGSWVAFGMWLAKIAAA